MKVFKLHDDAVLPTVKHKGDAGMDFYAYGNWMVFPHRYAVITTGVGVVVPDGYVGLIKPKSRSNYLIGAGVVDSNYRGEILIKVFNPTPEAFTIEEGQPVAQMVVLKCQDLEIVEIDKSMVADTNRGATGGIVDQRINRWD
jgi:dUTP pyrophosphatase